MAEFIKQKSTSVYKGRETEFILKGWRKGSVICDYEISVFTPLREVSKEPENNPAALFLQNIGDLFSEVGVDEEFTKNATVEETIIECDKGFFACDFGKYLKTQIPRCEL
jgi:hypothetical protein